MTRRATALPLALLLVLAGLLAGLLAVPALAAGTDQVEVVPVSRDGGRETSFSVESDEDVVFDLVNLSTEPRTARVYGASAARSASGTVSVGQAGSAPWLDLPEQQVPLGPQEVRRLRAPVVESALPEDHRAFGAVVLEAPQGQIVVRVATTVTVRPGSALPVPLWVAALAVVALLAAAVLLLLAVRRRRQERAPAPGAAA